MSFGEENTPPSLAQIRSRCAHKPDSCDINSPDPVGKIVGKTGVGDTEGSSAVGVNDGSSIVGNRVGDLEGFVKDGETVGMMVVGLTLG